MILVLVFTIMQISRMRDAYRGVGCCVTMSQKAYVLSFFKHRIFLLQSRRDVI